MKLPECLNIADIVVLRHIAEHYEFQCSKHSKMALIQEILYHFRDRRFLAEHVPTWCSRNAEALLRLSMDTRRWFSVEDITAMFRCAQDGAELQGALSEGWLFANTQQNGRFLFFIPDELQEVLRDAAIDRFAGSVRTDLDGPMVYRDEAVGLGRDIEVFLDYVRHHDVRLTTDGSMYKRNLTQLLELLEVEEVIPSDAWRFGYGRRFHEYPDRLALLYDFAHHKQFIVEREDAWLTVTDRAAEWVATAPLERQRQVFRFYVSVYRRPIPRLPLIIQLIAAVSPDWVQSKTMLSVLDHLVQDYYYDSREQVWRVRILKMLTHLGVVRSGADSDGEDWFQITKLGQQLITPDAIPDVESTQEQAQRILIVQPNFDIVVTADQPMVTAELAIFTDLMQSGMVRVYRLSEESMKRGLGTGKSAEDWIAFLTRCAQTAVPGNVERMIREWAKPVSTDIASAD